MFSWSWKVDATEAASHEAEAIPDMEYCSVCSGVTEIGTPLFAELGTRSIIRLSSCCHKCFRAVLSHIQLHQPLQLCSCMHRSKLQTSKGSDACNQT